MDYGADMSLAPDEQADEGKRARFSCPVVIENSLLRSPYEPAPTFLCTSFCLDGIRRTREHRNYYRARSQPGKPTWVMASRRSDVFLRLLRAYELAAIVLQLHVKSSLQTAAKPRDPEQVTLSRGKGSKQDLLCAFGNLANSQPSRHVEASCKGEVKFGNRNMDTAL